MAYFILGLVTGGSLGVLIACIVASGALYDARRRKAWAEFQKSEHDPRNYS